MKTIKNIPRYSAYKDSGVEWLGEIPINWKIIKLKYLVKVFNGDSLSPEKKELFSQDNIIGRPYVASKDIDLDTSMIDYSNGVIIPYSLKNYKIAPKSSILLCIEGGSAGKKVAYTDRQVSFVNKLACFHSNRVSNKFLYYSLKSKGFQYQFSLSLSGLIGGVAISAINNFFITVPILETQNRIVQFLDKNISQIDQAITIKEKQIKLIKERQKILIHKVVTQGLNPNVPMKNLGIRWINMIPEHWKVIRFKNIFSLSHLPVRPGDSVVTAYRDGQVTLRSNRRLFGYTEAVLEGGYQGIRKGQLVLNSMDAFEGAIGVSESDGKCTPEYVVCDPKSTHISQYYFAYLLREMAHSKYIQVICNAVRQRAIRIRFNNLATNFVIQPTINEQNKIVSYIENERKKIDKSISLLMSQIEKLKEYKATLIDSAVTGKIKITTEE